MDFILNGTSNRYDIQAVYNGKGFIGVLTESSQVFLAIYDANLQPFTYTGSEHIDIAGIQVPLNSAIQINGEIVSHPRNYDGAVFFLNMLSGTDKLSFRQTQSMDVSR